MARIKFNRHGEGSREALGMDLGRYGYQCLRWIKAGISLIQEKQFIFSKQFSNIFILSGISNISNFQVHDVLH